MIDLYSTDSNGIIMEKCLQKIKDAKFPDCVGMTP